MVATALKKEILSVEEYFEMEKDGDVRHEYDNGELYVISDNTKNHNKIITNIKVHIKDNSHPISCGVFSESIRLEVIKDKYYTYPDVALTCDTRDSKGDEYMVHHPSLLVEVLSNPSAGLGHGLKRRLYSKIPSVLYYMMISQYSISVELYTRIEGKKFWHYQDFESMADVIELKKLGFSIPVKSIYENIKILPENENGEKAD